MANHSNEIRLGNITGPGGAEFADAAYRAQDDDITWIVHPTGPRIAAIVSMGAAEHWVRHEDARHSLGLPKAGADQTTRLARLLALLVADRGLNRFAAVTEDSELSRELERYLRNA